MILTDSSLATAEVLAFPLRTGHGLRADSEPFFWPQLLQLPAFTTCARNLQADELEIRILEPFDTPKTFHKGCFLCKACHDKTSGALLVLSAFNPVDGWLARDGD